uniref:Phytosulfokine-beta n=1 Tax=Brassica campestris TaxID=3711 RepID=A0A3P6APQ7_BRACM|nr:unnamed protein product [Brassica rapa]
MSRPIMIVFLLVILIVTSQFEWRQPLLELDAASSLSQKHQQIAKREEAVKEKKNNIDSSCLCFEPTFEPEYTLQLVLFFTKMQRLLHSNSCFVFLLIVLIDTRSSCHKRDISRG